MASPVTNDGNRPTSGDGIRLATGVGYRLHHRTEEEEEKNRRLDPPEKSLRKRPIFSSDPPLVMVEPPPRPRTRRSKKALTQRPTTYILDPTQPHPIPPTTHFFEPPTTPTSSILSKLRQSAITHPVNDQEKGVDNQNISYPRPTPSSGNIHNVQESGRDENQINSSLRPTPCSGNTQNVQENDREETLGENHNQNNMHGDQEKQQTQEKV